MDGESITEREKFTFIFNTGGIIELRLKDNAVLDQKDSVEMESILSAVKNRNGYSLLVIAGKNTTTTSECRSYFKNHGMHSKALALIAQNLGQRIMVNFMIWVYRKKRPNLPVKMFSSTDKARKWLSQF